MKWLIIVVCIIWGYNWVVMKMAMDLFPPVLFSALRFLVASLFLAIILVYKRIPLPKKEDWKWYALCGLLSITYTYIIVQIGLMHLSIGVVSILQLTMPFWVSIMAHFLIPGEKLTPMKIAGIAVGFTGLFFVFGVDISHLQGGSFAFFFKLIVVTGGFAWGLGNIIIKKYLQDHDRIQFTSYHMFIGTIALFIFSFFYENNYTITWNWIAVYCLLYTGIIASALSYIVWFYVLSKTEASTASVALLSVPVIGTLSSWLFLNETLEWTTIWGIVLVLFGICVVNLKTIRFRKVKSSEADVSNL
jgi:O-acetylserine/cysteine efflux transporter